MGHARRLTTLRADQHGVRDMDGHGFLDDTPLPQLTLRLLMPLDKIDTLDNNLVELRQGLDYCPLLAPILACDDEHGVALLDIHFGPVQRSLF